MAGLNVKNRTLFTGDNLDVMRGMNAECVDLIYLDPPLASIIESAELAHGKCMQADLTMMAVRLLEMRWMP